MPKTGETVVLSAADPLNLVGILVPGERVPAISGKTVTFSDGVALQDITYRDPEPVAAIGD
jgi:ATP-dependent Lhr-like helicase